MHAQLTALLDAYEQSGGLSAAQAAAELAGVEVGGGGAVQLHAQQAALAEARCRERFERRALEEFIKHSLHDLPHVPVPPPASALNAKAAAGGGAKAAAGGGGGGGGGGEDDVQEQEEEEAVGWSLGVDSGLAELQARVGMLGNAYRSHAQAWKVRTRAPLSASECH
jgi:hypothetical protein